jgi:hypothetical protein
MRTLFVCFLVLVAVSGFGGMINLIGTYNNLGNRLDIARRL